jgi:hypothetical protein
MAEVKNSFLRSKMNKDLDDRLLPNGEYRNAVNITINNSDGEDVGTAQTVRGNLQVIDFNVNVTGVDDLQVIGLLDDEASDTVFAFLTNNEKQSYKSTKYSAIVSWNVNQATTSAKIIAEGNWLNFSTLNPIVANLLEDLLFFTDNRNQPRKVNINNQTGYYTTEDQISVAKYYPYQSIELYQGSQVSDAEVLTTTSTSASADVNTVVCNNVGTLSIGDVLISGGAGVPFNTFVTGIDNLTVTLSQNVTIALSETLVFSSPETTMKDAISEYLPPRGSGFVFDPATPPPNTEFYLTDYTGYVNLAGTVNGGIGFSVFKVLGTSIVDTGSKVVSVEKDSTSDGSAFYPTLKVIVDQAPNPALSLNEEILFAIPNPYYDSQFASTANVDYLGDKFVRFSYRFKFDDGEYSLIAPFTQPCFIPQQDGYFLENDFIPKDASEFDYKKDVEISDEKRAYQSTEVSFMENKVNKITLNVPLPYKAGDIQNDLKIQEIDILYKESNEIAIKVVDTIPVNSTNFSGNDTYFIYEYGSKSPFKTIPESENTRVYDKVPVRAQSQEIISNRVVYANYQDKHMPPNFLNYNLAANEKFGFGPGILNSFGTSKIEYPNASLKQNRNYEVGIVLADRFGRQSTVILSESEFNSIPSYLASTIYNPFRDLSDQQNNPSAFDGESLKVVFNSLIPSTYLGSPGLYNGDQNSNDYNPLGWYSFKVVVKQTEQDYYNAYVAPIMEGYPLDAGKEAFETSHISLFGDNINKIPRDLQELGPTQKQFRSSVKLWPRVACDKKTDIAFTRDTNDTSPLGGSNILSFALIDLTGMEVGMGLDSISIPSGLVIEAIDTNAGQITVSGAVECSAGTEINFTYGSAFFDNVQFFPDKVGDIASAIGTIDDLFEIPESDPVKRRIGQSNILWQPGPSTPANQLTLISPGGGTPAPTPLEIQDRIRLNLTLKVGDVVNSPIYPTNKTFITSIQSSQDPNDYTLDSGAVSNGPAFRCILSDPPDLNIQDSTSYISPGGLFIGFSKPGQPDFFYNQDSDPLIARISTTKQAGVQVPASGYPTAGGALNIYEVEAQKSLLDIYWETSTSGLVSELNKAISDNPGGQIYTEVRNWNDELFETTHQGDNTDGVFVQSFRAVLFNESSIQPLNLATAELVSVYEEGNPSNTNNLLGDPYIDSFEQPISNNNGSFKMQVAAPYSNLAVTTGVNNLVFEIHFNHPNQDPDPPNAPPFIAHLPVVLNNVAPIIDVCPQATIEFGIKTSPQDTIFTFSGRNGSYSPDVDQLDLVWSLECSSHPTFFTIGNTINEEFPFLTDWGQVRPTQTETPEGEYDIVVTLTDGGGLFIECPFKVRYIYALNIQYADGKNSACMSNGGGVCGTPPKVVSPGSFTIINADSVEGAPFKLRGSASGPDNPDLEIGYTCRIFNNVGTEVAVLVTGTDTVSENNESETVDLFDGSYTYEITINSISQNFPTLPTEGVTQATAIIVNEP